jgi:hypothetical protein
MHLLLTYCIEWAAMLASSTIIVLYSTHDMALSMVGLVAVLDFLFVFHLNALYRLSLLNRILMSIALSSVDRLLRPFHTN